MHLTGILDRNHVVGGLRPSLVRLGFNSSYNFDMRKILQRGSVSRFPARSIVLFWRGVGRRGSLTRVAREVFLLQVEVLISAWLQLGAEQHYESDCWTRI